MPKQKKQKSNGKPAKTWVFTSYDVSEQTISRLKLWSPEVTRMVVNRELCPTTERPHLQGQVTFKRARRMNQVQKLMSCTWQEAKSTQDSLYCMKINDTNKVVVNIDNRQQGHRKDLDEVKQAIDNGSSITDLWNNHFNVMVRYSRAMREYMQIVRMTPETTTHELMRWPLNDVWDKSIIAWGQPGIGKTVWAQQHFKAPLLVSHMDDLLQFDAGTHDGIIFDDMSFTHMPRQAQIHLVDVDFPRSIHCRFFTARIPKHTKKIFTCNDNGGHIFDLNDNAISRRVRTLHLYTD